MTEHEWLTSTDPQAMLTALEGPMSPNMRRLGAPWEHEVTDRKLRLFACGMCRLVWDGAVCKRCNGRHDWYDALTGNGRCYDCHGTGRVGGLTDPRSRRAVEVAECFADGEEVNLFAVREALYLWDERDLAVVACSPQVAGDLMVSDIQKLMPPQAPDLLRCVVGNPFRHDFEWGEHFERPFSGERLLYRLVSRKLVSQRIGGPFPDEEWEAVAWITPTALAIARTIYDERRWDELPILADALEDAGCDNADILAHLRGPGPHTRGCWVVDLILGK